jgi:hypothetical protein
MRATWSATVECGTTAVEITQAIAARSARQQECRQYNCTHANHAAAHLQVRGEGLPCWEERYVSQQQSLGGKRREHRVGPKSSHAGAHLAQPQT